MEFGIWMNRKFYQDMKDYLRALGVRVPIVTSNLIAGAADVYSHTDGDIMENNCYFNHPLMPVQGNTYLVAGPGRARERQPADHAAGHRVDGHNARQPGGGGRRPGQALHHQ